MYKRIYCKKAGFTLFELMLVVTITGLMLAVILPRAQRAKFEAQMSLVRQNASEVGGYVVQWAQKEANSVDPNDCMTVGNFIVGSGGESIAPAQNPGVMLVEHYTGNQVFDGVERLVNPDNPIRNPFNQVSIFDRLNDDFLTPGKQPGLLYLASAFKEATKENKKPFRRHIYFIFTGLNQSWHGSINTENLNGIRRGIFVTMISESRLSPVQSTQGENPPQ